MKRSTLIYALVLLLVLTAIVAIAQGNLTNAPANQPAECFANCQQILGLSQDQVAEMTRIRTSFVNNTATLRTDLQAKMKEIANLWAVDDPNLQSIKQKAAGADQIRAKIRDRAIDTRGAMMKVLTPMQRATCNEQCQSGKCGCGMCTGLGMGMGMCGMGGNNAVGTCPQGTGMGKGCSGAGMVTGGSCGMGGGANCPIKK